MSKFRFRVRWTRSSWQRRRILENTARGKEAARQRGVKFGRRSKLTAIQRSEIIGRIEAGEFLDDIARVYDVSLSTISRVRP